MSDLGKTPLVSEPAYPLLMIDNAQMAFAPRGVLAPIVREQTGLTMPEVGGTASNRTHSIIWTGRDQWLILGRFDPPDHTPVSNQSHARAVFLLPIKHAREILAAGTAVDLREEAFPVGTAAATVIDHIPVLLWRNAPERLAAGVPASYGMSFNGWLEHHKTLQERHFPHEHT
ncbi:MAG: hypothetical protein MI755_13870 [Sphingomonadales bacterium]|nr:hypothetical protein [Sphingomonadales bacterium]